MAQPSNRACTHGVLLTLHLVQPPATNAITSVLLAQPDFARFVTHLTLPSGEDPRRALQIWRWMYYDNNWISSFQDTLGAQNGFSQSFIDKAGAIATVDGGLLLQQVAAAQDGTTKLVFKLTQGEGAGGPLTAAVGDAASSAAASGPEVFKSLFRNARLLLQFEAAAHVLTRGHCRSRQPA